MKRWVFKFGVALSLFLCLATLVLWVRSYSASDLVKWESTWHVTLVAGIVERARTAARLKRRRRRR